MRAEGWRGVLLGVMCLASQAALARAGDTVRVACPCVADTTLSAADPAVRDCNTGGADQLTTSAEHTFALLRFDLATLKNIEVAKATLRVRRVKDLLVRAGVSTVAAGEWTEGTATEPQPQEGSACFSAAAYAAETRKVRWWGPPGGDFLDVTLGNGGSRWASVVPRFDKQSLWYEIDVPPPLVQAMVQGLQTSSLCISDDFGRSETSPRLWSRESDSPPELIVEGVPAAGGVSRPPAALQTFRDTLGREWLRFAAPHALGFQVLLAGRPLEAAELHRAALFDPWALPAPGAEPRHVLLSVYRKLEHRYVGVRVTEPARDWSPLVWTELPPAESARAAFTAPKLQRFDLPTLMDRPFTLDAGPSLSLDGFWIRSTGQTWWDPYRGPVALQAGRNEFVAFQVILAGGPGRYAVTLANWQSPGLDQPAPRARLYRQHYVLARLGHEKYAPDAAVPMAPGETLDLALLTPEQTTQPATQPTTTQAERTARPLRPTSASQAARREVVQGVWVDVYVPHKAATGVWRNRVIVLRDGQALLDIPIELEVVNPTLPDTLGFKVSLGTVRLPGEAGGYAENSAESWALLDAYQRTAHEHRATLAIVPYLPTGQVRTGFAPPIVRSGNGPRVDWEEWDRRFGPYLDGSAFRDLPREAVPVDHFVLPSFEAWPEPFEFRHAAPGTPLARRYHWRPTWTEPRAGARSSPPPDSYMAWPVEEALGDEYRRGNQAVLGEFARHLKERGWTRTEYQLFLGNQYGQEQSSWWLLREPRTYDDHLALRCWLRLFREALAAERDSPIRLRADLTLPSLQRGLLTGLIDRPVVSTGLFDENYLLFSAPPASQDPWYSAAGVSPELGWSTALRWGWAARLAGARGMVLHETVGDSRSWDKAHDALFYPSRPAGPPAPCVSLRLKALRSVQQDLDWLEQWLAQQQVAGVSEGRALAVVASEVAARTAACPARRTTLLPVLEFPDRVDTVAFEELRRGLRTAGAE